MFEIYFLVLYQSDNNKVERVKVYVCVCLYGGMGKEQVRKGCRNNYTKIVRVTRLFLQCLPFSITWCLHNSKNINPTPTFLFTNKKKMLIILSSCFFYH